MAFVAIAKNACFADDLAKYGDLPSVYRGQRINVVPAEASVSRNGVAYFPFESEKEVGDWMESKVSEWWDDETI